MEYSPLTLRWFLNNPDIDNLEFIGEESCLDKPITGVNVIDNPDGVPWIKRNELVLTTGYIFYNDIALTKKLIRELHDIDCTALCIKVKRYYDTVPDFLQEEAARYHLPLVAVPFYHSYSDIMRVVFSELETRHFSDKSRIIQETSRFYTLFSNNAGISDMLAVLAEYNRSIVLITDYHNSTSYYHIPASVAIPALIARNITVRADSAPVSGGIRYYWLNNQHIPFVTFPLPGGKYFLSVDVLSAPPSESFCAIIQNCLPVLSIKLEALQINQRRIASNNHFAPFFNMISDMKSRPGEECKLVCNTFSFPYDNKRVCVTFEVNPSNQGDKFLTQIYERISNSMENSKQSYFLSFYNNYVVLYLFFAKSCPNLHAVNTTHLVARSLEQDLDDTQRLAIRIGISRSHSRLVTIGTAFEESLSAINLQSQIAPQVSLSSYFRQTPYHLLKTLSHQQLAKLYNDSVDLLVQYDQQNNTNLVNTLYVYLENGLVIGKTARQLFIHRNTLTDHLNLIRAVLGSKLDSMEDIFGFYLGLCAYHLLKESPITPGPPKSAGDS